MTDPLDLVSAKTIDILDTYCRNLSSVPLGPEPPPATQRGDELKKIFRELADRRSCVLVGPPGVGKTSLIHHAISLIRKKKCPAELAGFKFYESSCSNLMADTKYLGEWDTKVFALVKALSVKSVLVLTDLWNIMGTGSYEKSARDLFDALLSALQRGEVILLGEMAEGRFQSCRYRNPAFGQVFTHLKIEEPDPETVKTVLGFKARSFARRYGLDYGPETLERVYSVCRRLIPYEVFPGKGVRLLQRVFAEASTTEGRQTVDPALVWKVFAAESGLPPFMLDLDQPMDLEGGRRFFQERVVGQDEAIDRALDTLALFKAQLNDPSKPLGVFFFVGPTGVGKTELAKAIASYLFGSPDRLIRVDMSEYASPSAAEKLIGASHPGAHSYESHGILLRRVREQPFSVVLLDEFEKSHPAIHDLMLQVMSDGRLTDSLGETTDFRNTILVLTSNLGSERISSSDIGFTGTGATPVETLRNRVLRDMEAAFKPEFINRLDHVLVFGPLERSTMVKIARKEIEALAQLEGIRDLESSLEVDAAALDLLVQKGFDPRFGARPLKRAVRELIVTPIARAMVTRPDRKDYVIIVTVRNGNIHLESIEEDEVQAPSAVEVAHEDQVPTRMTVKEVASSIEAIMGRIARAEKAFGLETAKEELERLDQLRQKAETWSDPGASDKVENQYHRLSSDIHRFARAREMARVVLESAELGMRRRNPGLLKEIGADYERLVLLVARIEQEALLFDSRDRLDCLVTVLPAGVGGQDPAWLEELALMYAGWSRTKAYGSTVMYCPPLGDPGTLDVAFRVLVEGSYAYGYLKGEAGLHRRVVRRRGTKNRKELQTTMARIEVMPLLGPTEMAGTPPVKGDFNLTPMPRLRGPGSASGVRINGPGGKPEIVLLNDLSLAVNREIGTRILRSGILIQPEPGDRNQLVRIYDMGEHHVVKDRRTGVSSHKLDRVLGGELDGFLVGYLEKERAR